jgi:hypothetical protein
LWEKLFCLSFSIKAIRFSYLKRKTAWEIARVLRKTADKVEKHSGTQMIIDSSGSTLITAYRRKK